VQIAIGWCGEFDKGWRAGRLSRAYRPSVMFQSELGRYLAAAGEQLAGAVHVDEDLGDAGLSTEAKASIRSSNITFLTSHGKMDAGAYRFRLHGGTWKPTDEADTQGPAVVVLDTCNVVDGASAPEMTDWVKLGRPSPALILGFVGPATEGRTESLRGKYFARYLADGYTYANAWFAAIRVTQPRRNRDIALAMAFGADEISARTTLSTASLNRRPLRTTADACSWRTE
jgi:hypothetical protein